MFKILETWNELTSSGRIVAHKRANFGSIEEQLIYLRNMVEVYRGTTFAKELALKIITQAGCEDRNKACQALAIAEWVQDHIRYVNEIPETFQTPPRTVALGAGDCDDHTTLIATLTETIGIPTEVVGMKVNGAWKHVFPRAEIQTGPNTKIKIPLDSTLKDTPVREVANPITRALERGWKVETFVPPAR